MQHRGWLAPLVAALAVACGKPEIGQECTMNGFGAGSCSFTNKGGAAGSVCGHIVVRRNDLGEVAKSGSFCSGEVAKQSTAKVDFHVSAVNSACDDPLDSSGSLEDLSARMKSRKSWSDNCSFSFVKD